MVPIIKVLRVYYKKKTGIVQKVFNNPCITVIYYSEYIVELL